MAEAHAATSTQDPINPGVSDALDRVVQTIVHNKYLIDCAVADHGASMLARDLHDGAYGPHEPFPFLCHILPFYRTCERPDDGSPAYEYGLVPTANTIGCSWRWRHKSLSAGEVESCRERLTDFAAMVRGKVDPATYAWVKPLGIFVPGEGKNRVDFLREEGIVAIPAKVYERTYPEPSRIVVYEIRKSAFSATWAVLDGRWVENVPNPSWTLPLMEAYGVNTGESWPSNFPEPELVQLALFQRKGATSPLGNPDFGNVPVVDLETIWAIEAFETEPVQATIFDMRDAKIDHRLWKVAAVVALGAGALLSLLPDTWNDARIIAGMAFGAAITAFVLPYAVPFVVTKRNALAKDAFLPLSRAPKEKHRAVRHNLG